MFTVFNTLPYYLSVGCVTQSLFSGKTCGIPRYRPAVYSYESGFGGLEVVCWPLVPKFADSHPAEAVGFLGRKKSSARLLSERK